MKQKVALVTGASGGIGSAIAITLARAGYAVAIGCRNTAMGEQTARTIRDLGGTALVCPCDVTDAAAVKAMVNAARTLGEIDLLVPAAGIAYQNLFQYTDEETYDRLMDTNVKGAYLAAKEVLPSMIARQSGAIIFISSITLTAIVIVTGGIQNGAGNPLFIGLVLALIMVVNAGYGGGFSNVPTLLSDHYGMGSISALHGITLSAWAFAGLTGNQLATWIVANFGKPEIIDGYEVNPVGYQYVLYVTLALYIVATVFSFVFVRAPKNKQS